jgi:hypothetical protein
MLVREQDRRLVESVKTARSALEAGQGQIRNLLQTQAERRFAVGASQRMLRLAVRTRDTIQELLARGP